MKKIIEMIMILTVVLFYAQTVEAQPKTMDSYTLTVTGLGCPFCAYGLEKKFKEFKGIKDISIDMETGIFTFSYPSASALSVQEVTEQVKKAGYTPIDISIKRADGSTNVYPTNKESSVLDQDTKAVYQVRVSGNCDMCKARIEQAALAMTAVTYAEWDQKTKMLKLSFDEKQHSLEEIEKTISAAGHDTEHFEANDSQYNTLPGCCRYTRKNKE